MERRTPQSPLLILGCDVSQIEIGRHGVTIHLASGKTICVTAEESWGEVVFEWEKYDDDSE